MAEMNSDVVPPVAGREDLLSEAEKKSVSYFDEKLGGSSSACAVALHMHQPMIPAGPGGSLNSAKIISNLEYMLYHGDDGERYNASIYRQCYQRLGDMIPELVARGCRPRVLLDYSGTLLHGLMQMEAADVFDRLRRLTHEYPDCVEWTGTSWGHAVAPSTPPEDFRLHVSAWRQHFADIFGLEALARVKGFSPPEMALPNDPDVAFEFVRTLLDCGYTWVMVQEHTVEDIESGGSPRQPYLPHELVCHNSKGQTVSIIAIIKTQGSDTKLVAQMQPWFEAQSMGKVELAGKVIPPLVFQIADGENGGVMMNEFPPKYMEVVELANQSSVSLCSVSAYLEFLGSQGLTKNDFPKCQPIWQGQIWKNCQPGDGEQRVKEVIKMLSESNHKFHVEGGSWTSDISWVKGYEGVLNPMAQVSSLFHEKIRAKEVRTSDEKFSRALYYLMLSQTSCYRYWGQGMWTDYGKEICRRAEEVLRSI